MFRLIGVCVVMLFFFKFGKKISSGRGKEVAAEIPKKVKKTFDDAKTSFKRYYKEIITDETGKTKKRIRVIEEIDKEEYLELKDEV